MPESKSDKVKKTQDEEASIGLADLSSSSSPSPTTDFVFRTVDSGKREEIEKLVMDPRISLGLVDPVDGITLVYDLLTKVISSLYE